MEEFHSLRYNSNQTQLTFTGRMLQHLQCSFAPAVGRMLQQLQRSACMYLFSSHHVYLRQKPKQTPLWFPQKVWHSSGAIM